MLMLVHSPMTAATKFKKVGTTGFIFLEIPVTAKTASMGEASITMEDGAQGVFANPALLGILENEHSAGITFANWFAETQHQAFSYAYHAGDLGVFSVNVDRLDFGTMTRTVNGANQQLYNILGDFSADGTAFGVSYAQKMSDRFSFGGSLKYVQERIAEYTASNPLVDVGIVYHTGYHSLTLGGVFRNFGVDAKYLVGLFKMPTELRLGASMNVIGNGGLVFEEEMNNVLLLTCEASHPSDNEERMNLGAEYSFQQFLFVRGGYKLNYDEETWSAGGGLRWSLLVFDFAYADYGRLGGVMRLSLGVEL
jgi:hypothetical protein